jgi:hypothetical protein
VVASHTTLRELAVTSSESVDVTNAHRIRLALGLSAALVAVSIAFANDSIDSDDLFLPLSERLKLRAQIDDPTMLQSLNEQLVVHQLRPDVVRSLTETCVLTSSQLGQSATDTTSGNTATAIMLAQPVARALAQLHRFGLLHRNVAPCNVWCVEGSFHLAHFGLACFQHASWSTRSPPSNWPSLDDDVCYSTADDVWAYGRMLQQQGVEPFLGDHPDEWLASVSVQGPDAGKLPTLV